MQVLLYGKPAFFSLRAMCKNLIYNFSLSILQYIIVCATLQMQEESTMDAQFKKGVLELCVLSQLQDSDRYGYELTETISQEMSVTAGTLYLILKRLKDNGYLETYLKESSSGPARKYYHLTDEGKEYQKNQKEEWIQFVKKVEKLI